ncbi:hypothetical protein ABPG77_009008 [Micractinium sp. CCAP 211/92]
MLSGLRPAFGLAAGRPHPRSSWPAQRTPCHKEGPGSANRQPSPPCAVAAFAGSGGGAFPASPLQPPSNAVKVYEAGKQSTGKRIVAETVVQAPVDVVWRVLTNYERLADFVPNLESCERLPSQRAGKVLLRQRGCSQGVLWRLEAEALLEVEEVRLPLGRREARFSMLEGDFQEMSGRWVVEPDPSSAVGMATLLRFDICVRPKITLPSAIVSYVVRAGLPANIQAVARRAEEISANKLRASGLARWAGTEDDPPIPSAKAAAVMPARPGWEQEAAEEEAARAAAAAVDAAQQQQQQGQGRQPSDSQEEGLPSKGPFWRLTGSSFPEAAPLTAAQQRQRLGLADADTDAACEVLQGSQRALQQQQQSEPQSLYLGVVSVPLPPAGNRGGMQPETQAELNQRQAEKEQLQAAYPAFGLRRTSSRGSVGSSAAAPAGAGLNGSAGNSTRSVPLAAAEVHLRRLDTFETLHRRAVAAITIDAPPDAVWAVLTDYDRLAEFIPNLAVSQRIALPRSAPSNIIRVRQVGYKRMLYMCLHAESVLDLIEKPESEIQFRQVAGDFERFQGKWMLQGISSTSSSSSGGSGSSGSCSDGETQLKYAVEIVIPRATRMLGVLEPLLERTVFEDVPANLAAIKLRVETIQAESNIRQLEESGEAAAAAALRRKLERPPLADMVEDFGVLVAELERCFGADRVLPSRSELREMNRSDLEKAISAHGGPSVVAQQLGWKLKAKGRRPKGYWDSLENVRAELDEFIEEQGLPPGVMPAKNDFVRASRYDIARAVERWGGLYELAEELGYAVETRKPGTSEWQEHISEVAASTGLSGRQGLFKLAAKTYGARRSLSSLDMSSIDASDEAALADLLAPEANSIAVASNATGTGILAASTDGNLPAVSASSADAGSRPGAGQPSDRGGGSKAAKGRSAGASRRTSRPTVREEIDAW